MSDPTYPLFPVVSFLGAVASVLLRIIVFLVVTTLRFRRAVGLCRWRTAPREELLRR